MLWRAKQAIISSLRDPKRLYQDLKWALRRMAPTISVPLGAVSSVEMPSNYHLARLLWEGRFEKEAIDFMKRSLRPGMTVFDVGANVGVFSVLASELVGDRGLVHCFEPGEEECLWLHRNKRANRAANLIINRVGVMECEGVLSLHEYAQGLGPFNSFGQTQHRLVRGLAPKKRDVAVTSLDAYAVTSSVDTIDMLKIDVEGAEMSVLRGCERLFADRRCKTIMCELCDSTAAGFNYPAREIPLFLQRHGFTLFHLDGKGGMSLHTVQQKYHYLELVASLDSSGSEGI